MTRLTPDEIVCLERDTTSAPWTAADVAVVAGEGLSLDEVVAWIRARIGDVPRWRQRVRSAGLASWWSDDATFDPSRHVRALSLPARSSVAQLQQRVQELLCEPLPADGPRWEVAVVGSLRGRRSALVTRVNPAWVGQIDPGHLVSALLADAPHGTEPVAQPWQPAPELTPEAAIASTVEALRDPAAVAFEAASGAARVLRRGLRASGVAPAPRERRFVGGAGFAEADLGQIARRDGVQVADVIVALVCGALASLGERRNPTAALSVADPGQPRGVRTHVAVLPLATPSPGARLEQIATLTQAGYEASGTADGSLVDDGPGFAAPARHARAAAQAAYAPAHQLLIALAPGPSAARYLGERELLASYPVLAPTAGQRLTVGATSYRGQVLLGLCGVRPVDDLAAALSDEFHSLRAH